MNSTLQNDVLNSDRFVITVELVPGSTYMGAKVDTVLKIAADALADGRVSAVTITDNPGGNPSLSPDVIGREILDLGMDVAVHFTSRDMNRGGIESRALQLARLGMKNILALTGDYSGKGFGGKSSPVFDIDSTILLCFLKTVGGQQLPGNMAPAVFFTGCAVSPFKATEAETYLQYYKLCKKAAAGAGFIITQVGFDARKFQELLLMQNDLGINLPTLGSIFYLTPRAAKAMYSGKVPGVVITHELYEKVVDEWQSKPRGHEASVNRCAKLASVLRGLGYRGIHIGGVHRDFATAQEILDRMEQIQDNWRDFLPEFDYPQKNGFYVYRRETAEVVSSAPHLNELSEQAALKEHLHYAFLKKTHDLFFSSDSRFSSSLKKLSRTLDTPSRESILLKCLEDPGKKLLLGCLRCGDCGIQHLGYLCPESQCPKHIRNGQCGGSLQGMCEVHPDRQCVWVRAYKRLARQGRSSELAREFVPPRMWELNDSSSWLNFQLDRDHQSVSCSIANYCGSQNRCVRQDELTAKTASITLLNTRRP